jgi:hypothetical protein
MADGLPRDLPAVIITLLKLRGLIGTSMADSLPGGFPAWGFAADRYGNPQSIARFRVIWPAESARALAVPFAMTGETQGRRIAFVLGDGTRLETALPSAWGGSPAWRAAVLPAALLARHGGPVMVEVTAGGGPWLAVGTPLLVMPRPEWSKIF